MRSLLHVAAILALLGLASPPASPAGEGVLAVIRAEVRFGGPLRGAPEGSSRGRLRMEGDLVAGTDLAAFDAASGPVRLALGPCLLRDGAGLPEGARVRDRGARGWTLRVPDAFDGRGFLSLRVDPAAGTFLLKAAGFEAGSLRQAGPAGVVVDAALGTTEGTETVDFRVNGPRAWSYDRVVDRPPPPGGGGGGGGGPPAPSGFATVDRGFTSAITTFRFEVVRDDASWQALWQAHGGAGSAPSVDFAAEMVIGVWLGTRPNGGVACDVLQVTPANIIGAPCTPEGGCPPGGAIVLFAETQSGPGCGVPMAVSQPYHIVRAPRVDGPVMYEMTTRVQDCP